MLLCRHLLSLGRRPRRRRPRRRRRRRRRLGLLLAQFLGRLLGRRALRLGLWHRRLRRPRRKHRRALVGGRALEGLLGRLLQAVTHATRLRHQRAIDLEPVAPVQRKPQLLEHPRAHRRPQPRGRLLARRGRLHRLLLPERRRRLLPPLELLGHRLLGACRLVLPPRLPRVGELLAHVLRHRVLAIQLVKRIEVLLETVLVAAQAAAHAATHAAAHAAAKHLLHAAAHAAAKHLLQDLGRIDTAGHTTAVAGATAAARHTAAKGKAAGDATGHARETAAHAAEQVCETAAHAAAAPTEHLPEHLLNIAGTHATAHAAEW